jgi:hypothetical protein
MRKKKLTRANIAVIAILLLLILVWTLLRSGIFTEKHTAETETSHDHQHAAAHNSKISFIPSDKGEMHDKKTNF